MKTKIARAIKFYAKSLLTEEQVGRAASVDDRT